jgi:5-methylcytosine-specific restriction endonuclease McrA
MVSRPSPASQATTTTTAARVDAEQFAHLVRPPATLTGEEKNAIVRSYNADLLPTWVNLPPVWFQAIAYVMEQYACDHDGASAYIAWRMAKRHGGKARKGQAWYRAKGAAELSGLKEGSIYAANRVGHLPGFRAKTHLLLRRRDLNAWWADVQATPEVVALYRYEAKRKRVRQKITPRFRKAWWSLVPKPYRMCRSCGSALTLSALHIDHIIPVVEGGDNAPWNLQPLCGPCNLSKGARVPC